MCCETFRVGVIPRERPRAVVLRLFFDADNPPASCSRRRADRKPIEALVGATDEVTSCVRVSAHRDHQACCARCRSKARGLRYPSDEWRRWPLTRSRCTRTEHSVPRRASPTPRRAPTRPSRSRRNSRPRRCPNNCRAGSCCRRCPPPPTRLGSRRSRTGCRDPSDGAAPEMAAAGPAPCRARRGPARA